MKKPVIFTILALASIAAYAGHLAWRASKDMVTLHVRNADIKSVVRSLRWQTWENIIYNKEIKGKITIDVDKMPLDQVLQIMSEQGQFRWTKVYPVYLHKASLASLQSAIRGEIKFSESSFTNYQSRSFPGGMRGRGLGEGSTNQPGLVSLVLSNKDLTISAMALSRASQAQVVPENGLQPKLNLVLSQVPFEDALDQIADQAKRSWTLIYALQTNQGGPGFAGMMAGRGGSPGSEMRQRGGRADELLDTLPPEERQKAEERRQERQAMESLSQEQRQQVMSERMNNPEMQQRAEQRMTANLRNSTPEQRRENYQRMNQMRKARAAAQGQSR